MGDVINMSEHKTPDTVRPKSESRVYNGHRYTLSFKPTADILHRWEWKLKFTRIYEFAGSAATIDLAAKQAIKQVDTMEGRSQRAAGK